MVPVETITDWIVDANTCFLLGAGCSVCAGKPTMDGLTEAVKSALSDQTTEILSNLKGSFERAATVEDLMNHLLQLHRLLSSYKQPQVSNWTTDAIDKEIAAIQSAIVRSIGTDWISSEQHKKFFQRLIGQKTLTTRDVFCLNYDTLCEASLEELRIPYTDGFCGAENAYFDPALYEDQLGDGLNFRVYKLHGSVNWVRDEDEAVRRRPSRLVDDSKRVVIYPAEQKYVQTQYGIYETLLNLFRKRLREPRPNNKLVVLGYSFGDEHVNVAIEDSIRAPGSNLTVYAFVGPEEDLEAQGKRLFNMATRCQQRFNVLIGKDLFIGPGIDEDQLRNSKLTDLWKFENLAELLAGGS